MKQLAIEILAIPTAAAVLVSVLLGAVVESFVQSLRARRER